MKTQDTSSRQERRVYKTSTRMIIAAGKYVVLFLVLSTFSGCTYFNCTSLEDYIGSDTDLITFSYKIADRLVASAMPPLTPENPNMPILVTTFVDNNDLRKTSKFGRSMQEHIASRMVQLGYTVKEIKLSNSLLIEEGSGETILSRDLQKLTRDQKAQAVLVGTISYTDRIMYISSRLINPISADIIASDDYRLCMDDHILAMFNLQRGENDDMIQEPEQPFKVPSF